MELSGAFGLTRRLRAMGSAASIVIVLDPAGDRSTASAAADAAIQRIEHLEQCWSRFIPSSDISRLNGANGEPVVVDPATIALVVAMVEAWRATAGAFDPTLLGAINALGYAADWSDASRHSCAAPAEHGRAAVDTILHDPVEHVVQLPLGMSLDAGGIGKGLAADLASAAALEAGALGVLVEIGGDLRVRGAVPDIAGWRIDVATPDDDASIITQLRLGAGGVATSSTRRRRWQTPSGDAVHHLIDPAVGLPTTTDLVQATVVAGTGAWAEAWSTAVMVRGLQVLPELDHLGLGVMAVDARRGVHVNPSWARFAANSEAVLR